MKKGQVTLFIILGIVIIFIIGTIFFIRSESLKSSLGIQVGQEVIPLQLRPVKSSIDSCVAQVSQDGLELMGLQAGYIDIPQDNIPQGTFNRFSNSLEILPGLKTPYWFYETSNGIQTLQIPTKEEMQNQLDNYIDENLNSCLENLSDFAEKGYDINFNGQAKTESKIHDNFVEISVDYPVDVSFKDVGKVINNHYAKLDIPLGYLYSAGIDILDAENSNYYLENNTLDILAIYDEIPFTGQSFNCVPKVWLKSDVEKNLKSILQNNIDAVKVKDTITPAVNNYYSFDTGKSYKNIETNFLYQSQWPFELRINGGDEILKEDPIVSSNNPATRLLMSVFCLNSYQFIYDIKYPVLIHLNKDNYNFQFATQVIIKNNQPRANMLGIDSIGDSDKRFCRTSGVKNTIFVQNKDTGSYLEDADVSVKCVATTCAIGKTTRDEFNDTSLTANFPSCLNAEIKASKQGFNDGFANIDTTEQNSVNIELKPKYSLSTRIMVLDNNVIRDLNSDESVFIELTDNEDSYQSVVSESTSNAELISGTYDVKSFIVTDGKNITLKGGDYQNCVDVPRSGILGLVGLKERKCLNSNVADLQVSQVISGGNDYTFVLDKNDLSQSKEITFYIVKNNVPETLEDLRLIFDKIKENNNNPNFRLPEIK